MSTEKDDADVEPISEKPQNAAAIDNVAPKKSVKKSTKNKPQVEDFVKQMAKKEEGKDQDKQKNPQMELVDDLKQWVSDTQDSLHGLLMNSATKAASSLKQRFSKNQDDNQTDENAAKTEDSTKKNEATPGVELKAPASSTSPNPSARMASLPATSVNALSINTKQDTGSTKQEQTEVQQNNPSSSLSK